MIDPLTIAAWAFVALVAFNLIVLFLGLVAFLVLAFFGRGK